MLDLDVVNQIEDALAEGKRPGEIARRFGVSRGTVAVIARGEWCLKARTAASPEPPRKLGKCPTCGRAIRLPCLACEARRGAGPLPALPPEADEFQLELERDDLARYREQRARHRRAGSTPNGKTPRPGAPRRCESCRTLQPSQITAHDRADDLAGEAEDLGSLRRLMEG